MTALYELSSRQERVLGSVVDRYVETARPVGSQEVIRRTGLDVSPATVRTELGRLAQMGLVEQPHISAGRRPTDTGYRYYVDHLMHHRAEPGYAKAAAAVFRRSDRHPDEMLRLTSGLLVKLTGQPCIVLAPRLEECIVRHLHLARVDRSKVMLILVLHTGQILHRLVADKGAISAAEIRHWSRELSSAIAGKRVAQIEEACLGLRQWAAGDPWLGRVLHEVAPERLLGEDRYEVYVEGRSRFFNMPDFQDLEPLAAILELLDEDSLLVQSILAACPRGEAGVLIGTENPLVAMRKCSLVARQYEAPDHSRGFLAVLGPTRMRYAQAVSALENVAGQLVRHL